MIMADNSATHFASSAQAIGQACAAVLALLNEVTAVKRESILALATLPSEAPAADAAKAPTAPSLTAAVTHAEGLAATLSQQPAETPLHLLECAAAQAIAMAIQNTVAADQQLDILAQAILAKRAAQLLGSGRPT
jgi:hypothetical protein